MKPGAAAVKRVIDVGVSLLGLVLLAPVMIIIAILIKASSRGPVFYPSRRVGRNGKLFTMYKFRSMYVDSPVVRNPDGSMRVDKCDSRVTRVGRVLRLGFDEFPQLLNILIGDMSLIGPRPDPLEALAYYGAEDWRRLSVPPGMTGLAQVAGRTDISWRERQKYDIEYVEHWSLCLDCKIAFYTVFEFIPPLRNWRFQRQARPLDQALERVDEARGASAPSALTPDVKTSH